MSMPPSAQWFLGGITAFGTGLSAIGVAYVEKLAEYHVFLTRTGFVFAAIGIICFYFAIADSARVRRLLASRRRRQEDAVQNRKRLAAEEEANFLRRLKQSRPAPSPTTPTTEAKTMITRIVGPSRDAQAPSTVSLTREEQEPYIFLNVTNLGPDATFWARLQIEGPVSGKPSAELFARWDHVENEKAVIPHGEKRRLRLARFQAFEERHPVDWLLGRSTVRIGHWYVPYYSSGRAGEAASLFDTLMSLSSSSLTLTITISADPALAFGSIVHRVTLPRN
jgi:hypothetical protein